MLRRQVRSFSSQSLHTHSSLTVPYTSGESGAGKTESAKLIIRHILELAPDGAGSAASDLEKKILQVGAGC